MFHVLCCVQSSPLPTCFRRWQMPSGQQSSDSWVGASGILRTAHPESLCPPRWGHGKPSCKCCPQLKSVIFYPVIPVCIVASVRSKSLSELVKPLPRLNGSAGWPVAGIISPHAAPGFPTANRKKAVPGVGTAFFLCDGDHQILVMSTRSASLMVVSMSRHSVRAMAVSTAVRQAMDRSTALRRICTECSAGLRPVALVEIR